MHDMRGRRQKERNEESSRHNACAAATQPSSKRIAFMIQDLHVLSFTIMNMHDRRHDDIQVSTMCFVVVFSNMYLIVYYPLPTLRTHVLTHSTIGRGWDKKIRNENGRRYDGHTTCFKVTHATATTSRHAFTITLVVVLFCQHLRAYCEVGV